MTNRPAPLKRFGQHFLTSPVIADRIVAAAGIGPGDKVLEVGPGRGILTGRLAASAGRLVAVEIDRRLAAQLSAEYRHHVNVEIIEGDVLALDLGKALGPDGVAGATAVANLPYNLAVPIIEKLLGGLGHLRLMVVMVQREVAQRMAACPGSRTYGSLSVFVQYQAEVRRLFDVRPGSFDPPPKVMSSVISLVPHEPPAAVEDRTAFFAFVKKLFMTRRKMLRATLRSQFGATAAQLEAMARIDLSRRPETLGIGELAFLFSALNGGR